jgi:hypothetical protein
MYRKIMDNSDIDNLQTRGMGGRKLNEDISRQK